MECLKLLSLGSDKPGKQTVHGLKFHLEKAHKELFAEYTTKLNARWQNRDKWCLFVFYCIPTVY